MMDFLKYLFYESCSLNSDYPQFCREIFEITCSFQNHLDCSRHFITWIVLDYGSYLFDAECCCSTHYKPYYSFVMLIVIALLMRDICIYSQKYLFCYICSGGWVSRQKCIGLCVAGHMSWKKKSYSLLNKEFRIKQC